VAQHLSATSLEILVICVKQNVSNLVFPLYVRVLEQGTRYSKVTVSLIPLLTLLAAATTTWSPVTPLLNAPFRHSAPSQILFSVTPRYVASY